jgi:acid phosphatase type 7
MNFFLKRIIPSLLICILFPVNLIVEPYLQNATPHSINILWETDSESQTIVEWGLSSFLTESTIGISSSNYGNSKIHNVELVNLNPDTRYYYRVVVGNYESYSELHDFITPPEASSEESFKIIAMSDMQRDASNPNKFDEIIHDGIIDYISEQHSDDLADELALVLVTGDLVVTGTSYYQWQDHFFGPSQDLFSHVPLYPVFGNHEADTDYFIKYFHLPDNGTPGYEEHWYYTDYSNLRVIGLDSNSGYQIDTQLVWLETVLQDACYNDNIDFVFVQLHHPHKSELWTPGETDYTGEVIQRMENFSDECGKPSIHFFGHTHGYSRGQSQNHNHLWVNVASAGGAIDYWGEWPQADYDEFTVTQDEWGFVIVDVEAGDNPQFILKRISRGNENIYRDNEQRDEIKVRMNNNMPDQPYGISPNGIENPDSIILTASGFSDMDGDFAMAAQWEIYQNCDLSSEAILSKFINMENWYYNENTQESVELTELHIPLTLSPYTDYCWSVRYRDTSLGWSEWSTPLLFETSESQYSDNLLINPGAEEDLIGWAVTEGYMESLGAYVCDGIEPHSGDYYFIVGALCNTATYAEAYQEIDVSDYIECIDQNLSYINYGGYLSDWGGSDYPEMAITFIDENGYEIDRTNNIGTYNSFWTLFSNEYQIPMGTRSVQMILMGTKYAGDDNDSYFDDLFLRVWQNQDCLFALGDLNQDTIINILDVILVINIILGIDDFNNLADINIDGNIDILDVVLIVNIILN